MLTSRKPLISNLNYVHLQQMSFGSNLSLRTDGTASLLGQDTGLKDVNGCLHQWKDTSDVMLMDPNSNDPSVPCQCCDQHSGHKEALCYSSDENLETIMCEDYLSPELPLSPLSPSSPSTDSSSSSDFTLDDSPISMYYREYAQEELQTPDQQPDIIPLDVESERMSPALEDSITPTPEDYMAPALEDSMISDPEDSMAPAMALQGSEPENVINNNVEHEDVPFIDWSSDSSLDSNCNTLTDIQPPSPVSSAFMETNRDEDPNRSKTTQWLQDEELLSGLAGSQDSSNPTPKKTITSFHELAQKRRKSGGQLTVPPKKDKSDWLIVFSPDTEQPPVNELTASAFYHGLAMPQPQPLPEGKEVTTFRELRYRNTFNKQSSQQARANKGPLGSAEGARDMADGQQIMEAQQDSRLPLIETKTLQSLNMGESVPQEQAFQGCGSGPLPTQTPQGPPKTSPPIPPPRRRSQRALQLTTQVNLPAMTGQAEPQHPSTGNVRRECQQNELGVRPQRLADGADHRGVEGAEVEPLMADGSEDGEQKEKKSLLVAISSAVDKIISHFNGSRKQVQKAQLGDSRLNPGLGYLIAEGLCPALTALLADGLKPFQKDVIIGRRRLSPWHLVEASAKTGPQAIQHLFGTVIRLQQLRDPQRRFNAFIFGLLNTKQLDAWLAHLHESYDQLCVFFLPSGFLPLAATSRPALREELLLTVQPLSALTFHTDLLFEHHHLPLQDPPTPQRLPNQNPMSAEHRGVPAFQHILDLGGWLAHSLASAGETPNQSESSGPAHDGGTPSEEPKKDAASPVTGPPVRDWGRNWWGQLTQASRMYIPSKKEPFTLTSLQKMTSWGSPEGEQPKPRPRGSQQAASPEDAPNSVASSSNPTARKQAPTNPTPEERAGWFGPLFGESSAQREPDGQRSRRPSSWLPPNVNVLDLIRKRPTPGRDTITPQAEEETPRRPERTLRALCDHSASGSAQLSFQKGDVLQLLGTVDDDWIQCRRGSFTGLVPVAYTSLIL